MNVAYEKLRSPMPQILGSLTLISLAMSGAQYFYGLTISETPWYLVIIWLFMLLVSISTFFIYVIRRPKNHKSMKRKALVLFIVDVLAMYSAVFAMYNIYYFLGLRKGIDLFEIWIVGTITMVFCSIVLYQSMLAVIEFNEEEHSNETRFTNHD